MGAFNRLNVLVVLAVFSLLFPGAAAQGEFTTLPYTDPLPPCYNGIQDGNETGVDCGGSCFRPTTLELCDGIDNNRDCLVDNNCKTNTGGISTPVSPAPAKPAPCYNGVQDSGEEGVDCGGTCFKGWIIESCDGVDNDKDCQVDEAEECKKTQGTTPAPQESVSAPVSMPAQQPVSAPVPAPESKPAEAVSTPAQPTPSIPAEESPSTLPVEVGGEEQIKWLRQFAKNNSIYIPGDESDAELLKKYTAFAEKHEAELTAKFQDKSPTEKDIAEVIKQFSDETYPKPEPKPQSQSFFSKVKGFFKRMFG